MQESLITAGKYADVRHRATRGARPPSASSARKAGKGKARPGSLLNIIVKQMAEQPGFDLSAWVEQELKEGRLLHEYLRREKAQTTARLRACARAFGGTRPNPKSDMKLLATVPARDYFRWLKRDPHFWEDDSNLKSLRRDNEEYRALIHV
ncbi:MAG TPA: hypothetical protein PLV05_14820 [Verrucomicrobiota bacterium]|nr:hypothetical protein [Verrucomicrobiota bacterium]HRR65970.1 hypothetical protein [Candidatus Paceibacterota bacterium]